MKNLRKKSNSLKLPTAILIIIGFSIWGIGCMDSNPEDNIFIATDDGIYRSTDYGNSWTLVCPEDYVRLIAINSRGHIYAVTYSGVIRSINNFKGWLYVNSGLGTYRVVCIAFGSNGYTFAGTRGSGVFRNFGD